LLNLTWKFNYASKYYLLKSKTSYGTSFGSIVNHPPGTVYPSLVGSSWWVVSWTLIKARFLSTDYSQTQTSKLWVAFEKLKLTVNLNNLPLTT